MTHLSRRALLAASTAALAPRLATAQAKPRLTAISQWSAGSDGAAITALGKKFEEKGGVWQHAPVPGFTTEMMNKLRAVATMPQHAQLAAATTRPRGVK